MTAAGFYLLLSAIVFALGALGVLLRRNAIVVFMCIEVMLSGVNLALVGLSSHFGTNEAQVYVFFVFAVAAAEAAVGLSIIISVFRNFYSVQSDDVLTMRG